MAGECIGCRTLDRVRALTRIVPTIGPTDFVSFAAQTPRVRGPYGRGCLVRLQAGREGLYWLAGAGSDVATPLADGTDGANALGPWDRVDLELTQDTYLAFTQDGEAETNGVVQIWVTDVIRSDADEGDPEGA